MAQLYILEFPNGKGYVGITSFGHRRFTMHKASARAGSNLLVHKAIRKYGEPTLCQLFEGTIEEMAALEFELIAELGTQMPNGYNMDPGGQHRVVSLMERQEMSRRAKAQDKSHLQDPVVRARQGETMKEVWERPGYREAVGAKISKALTGRKASEETKRRQSEAAKRRWANASEEDLQVYRDSGKKNAEKRWGG